MKKAIFYILDKENGQIKEQIDFGGKGDYEGVEMDGERVYVIASNGDLFYTGLKNVKALHRKGFLNIQNNLEGLGIGKAAINYYWPVKTTFFKTRKPKTIE